MWWFVLGSPWVASKALYGLKQASLAWWCTLNESLKELGFERLKSEAGIFFYKKKGTNVVVGVIC